MPALSSVRRVVRSSALEQRARRSFAVKAADTALRDRGHCFTFHRAVPSEAWEALPNRGFHIDIAFLEQLVTHLQATGWDIVTVDEALRRVARPGGGRFVNFSIDDCYRDTAELVVPLFQRLRVPVTLYLTTGIPDGTLRLRDAGLETILGRETSVTDEGQAFPLNTHAQKRAAYRVLSARWHDRNDDEAYVRFCERHGYSADALDALHRITWDQLDAMRGSPYVEIGAHTVSHLRISTLSPEDALAELRGCRERIEQRLGQSVRHFAFPYGRRGDCGQRDFALCEHAGFVSAATTRKGLMHPGIDPFCLPRGTLNGAHRRTAQAWPHLTGLYGLAARAMGRD